MGRSGRSDRGSVVPRPDSLANLGAELLESCHAMVRYALGSGLEISEGAIQIIEAAETRMAAETEDPGADSAAAEDEAGGLIELIATHNELSKVVAPARPESILLRDRERRGRRRFASLGSIKLTRQLAAASIFFLITFVASSLSPGVDIAGGDLTGASGWALLANELFLLSAAGMGAAFAALMQLNRYAMKDLYDPKYDSTYWLRVVLGLIGGIVLALVIPVEGSYTKPLLSLVGGFSAPAVHRRLSRLADKIGGADPDAPEPAASTDGSPAAGAPAAGAAVGGAAALGGTAVAGAALGESGPKVIRLDDPAAAAATTEGGAPGTIPPGSTGGLSPEQAALAAGAAGVAVGGVAMAAEGLADRGRALTEKLKGAVEDVASGEQAQKLKGAIEDVLTGERDELLNALLGRPGAGTAAGGSATAGGHAASGSAAAGGEAGAGSAAGGQPPTSGSPAGGETTAGGQPASGEAATQSGTGADPGSSSSGSSGSSGQTGEPGSGGQTGGPDAQSGAPQSSGGGPPDVQASSGAPGGPPTGPRSTSASSHRRGGRGGWRRIATGAGLAAAAALAILGAPALVPATDFGPRPIPTVSPTRTQPPCPGPRVSCPVPVPDESPTEPTESPTKPSESPTEPTESPTTPDPPPTTPDPPPTTPDPPPTTPDPPPTTPDPPPTTPDPPPTTPDPPPTPPDPVRIIRSWVLGWNLPRLVPTIKPDPPPGPDDHCKRSPGQQVTSRAHSNHPGCARWHSHAEPPGLARRAPSAPPPATASSPPPTGSISGGTSPSIPAAPDYRSPTAPTVMQPDPADTPRPPAPEPIEDSDLPPGLQGRDPSDLPPGIAKRYSGAPPGHAGRGQGRDD